MRRRPILAFSVFALLALSACASGSGTAAPAATAPQPAASQPAAQSAPAPAVLRALAAPPDDPTPRRLAASFARTADQGRPRAARGSGLAAGVVELGGRLRREIGR